MSRSMMRLKAHELSVDFEVQRSEEPAQCKKLAREWDDLMVGNLTASYRDGTFYLIDGQQRVTTKVKYLGDPDYEFDVLVHDDLTLHDEGRMFLAMNRDHKAVSAWDKFKVAATIGERHETQVNEIVEDYGYKVGPYSTEDQIGCPAALVRIDKNFGAAILHAVIGLNERMGYNLGDTNQWDAQFLEGAAIFINRYEDQPKFSMDRLVTAMRKNRKAQKVTTLVQAARAAAPNNNRAVGAVAELLFDIYNTGLHEKNRLSWVSPHSGATAA